MKSGAEIYPVAITVAIAVAITVAVGITVGIAIPICVQRRRTTGQHQDEGTRDERRHQKESFSPHTDLFGEQYHEIDRREKPENVFYESN